MWCLLLVVLAEPIGLLVAFLLLCLVLLLLSRKLHFLRTVLVGMYKSSSTCCVCSEDMTPLVGNLESMSVLSRDLRVLEDRSAYIETHHERDYL